MKIEQRLESVITRRQTAVLYNRGESIDIGHRIARTRLIGELPRFAAKLSSAVAVLNDRLQDSDIWLKIESADHSPTAEVTFTVNVATAVENQPRLIVTVDPVGNVRTILSGRDTRTLLHGGIIFNLDLAILFDSLVTLLEAHYH